QVLDAYAERGALYGHGVTLSVLSAAWCPRQQAWIDALIDEVHRRSYVHISEHLAFSTTPEMRDGAPLPMPRLPQVVEAGRRAMLALSAAAGTPVGLENLALALSPQDVQDEPALLDAILDPVDGFIVLDLHNLWCRAVNFGQDPTTLLMAYPQHRVRELHVSGGSWQDGFRRDTHDGAVPDEVFGMLPTALQRFPGVDVVVMEQLPASLETQDAQQAFQEDVRRIHGVLHG
ncbi:MAG: DUF692 family multinuclear iron-containing protein, partial [Myxococcota bacterium]